MEDYYRAVDVTWRTKLWEIEALWKEKKQWNTLTDKQKRERILEAQNVVSQYSRDFYGRFDDDRDLVRWDTQLAQRSQEANCLAYRMNDELTKKIAKELKQELSKGAKTLMAFSRSVNKETSGSTHATQKSKSKSETKKSKPSRADHLATRNAKKDDTAFDNIVEFNDEHAAKNCLASNKAPGSKQSTPNNSHSPEPSKSGQCDVQPAQSYLGPISDPLGRDEIALVLLSLRIDKQSQISSREAASTDINNIPSFSPNEVASILLSLGSFREPQIGSSEQPHHLPYTDQRASANSLKRKRCADISEKNANISIRPSKIIKLNLRRSMVKSNQQFNMLAPSKQANTIHDEEAKDTSSPLPIDSKILKDNSSSAIAATRSLRRRSGSTIQYKYEEDDSKSETHSKIKLRLRFGSKDQPTGNGNDKKNPTTAPGLRSSIPGRKHTDVICTSSDPEALQGPYHLLNQFGYPAYDKTAGRYLKTYVDVNGVEHHNFDQAVHLTVRLEDKTTHEILERSFPHPKDWNDPEDVKRAMKAAQQFCRRKAGTPGKKVRYSDEEVDWLKTYVAGKTKVNWAAVVNMSSQPWKALWKAWQLRFPESKRREEALWAKCGAGSDESRLGIINY